MFFDSIEASLAFCGALKTQGSDDGEGGPVGVGVRSLMSSCEMTFCGSEGLAVPLGPPRTFSGLNVTVNAL